MMIASKMRNIRRGRGGFISSFLPLNSKLIPTSSSTSSSKTATTKIQTIQTIHPIRGGSSSIRLFFSSINTKDDNDITTTDEKMDEHHQQPQQQEQPKQPQEEEKGPPCWNPSLRRFLGGISTLGFIETSYLTYTKLFTNNDISKFCSTFSSTNEQGAIAGANECKSVLDSVYATISLADDNSIQIPLSSLGMIAYGSVVILALTPLLLQQQQQQPSSTTVLLQQQQQQQEMDIPNRLVLLCLTTSMAAFSAVLISLLFNVLQQSCIFCYFSAALSSILAISCWFGGTLPSSSTSTSTLEKEEEEEEEESNNSLRVRGAQAAVASFILTIMVSTIFFVNIHKESELSSSTSSMPIPPYSPPSITTKSSSRALNLAYNLEQLHSKMYGAYWCSHCYDQKQRLGQEAMKHILYIECDAEGVDSQRSLCKERNIPGFPTWEIDGVLYPGDQELNELEDIVDSMMMTKRSPSKKTVAAATAE